MIFSTIIPVNEQVLCHMQWSPPTLTGFPTLKNQLLYLQRVSTQNAAFSLYSEWVLWCEREGWEWNAWEKVYRVPKGDFGEVCVWRHVGILAEAIFILSRVDCKYYLLIMWLVNWIVAILFFHVNRVPPSFYCNCACKLYF